MCFKINTTTINNEFFRYLSPILEKNKKYIIYHSISRGECLQIAKRGRHMTNAEWI